MTLVNTGMTTARRLFRILATLSALLGILVIGAWHGNAQSSEYVWTEPVNISNTGAASQPAFVIGADGSIHATWWDAIDGQVFSRLETITGTILTTPEVNPSVVGSRKVDPLNGNVELTAPPTVRMYAGEGNSVFTLWTNKNDQLFASRSLNGVWDAPVLIAVGASALDAYTSVSGTVHLAYARTFNLVDSPSGLYYRANNATTAWGNPTLVYASPYFRTSNSDAMHLSVAGDANGHLLITWEDTRLGQSYVRSSDNGITWGVPEPLTATINTRISQPVVGALESGQFMMLWRNLSDSGCGFTQRLSTDGGASWSTPEMILADLDTCPDEFSLRSGADGRMWLAGLTKSITSASLATGESTGLPENAGFIAAWDGKVWSIPVNLDMQVNKGQAGQLESLTCLHFALGQSSAALLGCTGSRDLYLMRNAVPLSELVPAQKPIWSKNQWLSPELTINTSARVIAPEMTVATTVDTQDHIIAMWSTTDDNETTGTALYAAIYREGKWSQAQMVIRPSAMSLTSSVTSEIAQKAEQPSLAADQQGRIHAVFSGGSNGQVQYSSALARDVTSPDGWSNPSSLPAPSDVASWPDIVADPRGETLYVLYGVPYNEKRGVWFTRSDNGGSTWSAAVNVADAELNNWNSVSKTRIALDAAANVLHATWLRAVMPGNTGLQAVYYARSLDGGQSWSNPLMVVEGAVDWPSVTVAASGQVHIGWLHMRPLVQADSQAPYELWSQTSTDSGNAWNYPQLVSGFDAVSGKPGFTSDGTGRLFVTALGEGKHQDSIVLYSMWNGSGWGAADRVILGQYAKRGNGTSSASVGATGQFQAVMRIWGYTNAGRSAFSIQSIGRMVDTADKIQLLATFTPVPSPTSLPTSTPAPALTSTPELEKAQPPVIDRSIIGVLLPPAVGVILAILAILGGLGIFFGIIRRSK